MAVTPAPIALVSGTPTRVATAVGATGGGTPFAFQDASVGVDFSAVFTAQGTVTSLTATLEVSQDGGTTWTTYKAAANFFNAVTAASSVIVTPIVAGPLYRINASVLTGSIDFWVTPN